MFGSYIYLPVVLLALLIDKVHVLKLSKMMPFIRIEKRG